MKIEITPYYFADIIRDIRALVGAARMSCELAPEDIASIDKLLGQISDKLEDIEWAVADVQSALAYLVRCMDEN